MYAKTHSKTSIFRHLAMQSTVLQPTQTVHRPHPLGIVFSACKNCICVNDLITLIKGAWKYPIILSHDPPDQYIAPIMFDIVLTLTNGAGNHPILSPTWPHHQSVSVQLMIVMTSPALKLSSSGSIVTWSHRASANASGASIYWKYENWWNYNVN